MPASVPRPIIRILVVFVLLVAVSIGGYMLLEGYGLLDAAYMTALALSTVGFGEVRPLSPAGRAFTIFVILMGAGTAAYFFTTAAEFTLTGELGRTLRRRRVMSIVRGMRDHYLICGFGRVGQQVGTELESLGLPYVVVDDNKDAIRVCVQRNVPFIEGDATDDEVLRHAGIERARGLVSVLPSDPENVFVVLSARSIKRDLVIVARATTADAEGKLLKAGANRVVSPYVMAGHRLVGLLVRPNVVNLLDPTTVNGQLPLSLEEIVVDALSPLAGRRVTAADVHAQTGANVLAILRPNEQRAIVDWTAPEQLNPGDILIVLGGREQLAAVAALAGDPRVGRAAVSQN
ncbi:MAG: potassium channel protein [Anaerolineae bacterium]